MADLVGDSRSRARDAALSAFGAAGVALSLDTYCLIGMVYGDHQPWLQAESDSLPGNGHSFEILGVFMIVIACHFIWSGIQMIR